MYDWVESVLFDFFRGENTVPATYMSYLVIFIALFGFRKLWKLCVCESVTKWILLECCILHSTLLEKNEFMDHIYIIYSSFTCI